MLLSNCAEDEQRKFEEEQCADPPFSAQFIKSPEFFFFPYFEITNTSRSYLKGLEVYHYDGISTTYCATLNLSPGEVYRIDFSLLIAGDKVYVHFPEIKCVSEYTFW